MRTLYLLIITILLNQNQTILGLKYIHIVQFSYIDQFDQNQTILGLKSKRKSYVELLMDLIKIRLY